MFFNVAPVIVCL